MAATLAGPFAEQSAAGMLALEQYVDPSGWAGDEAQIEQQVAIGATKWELTRATNMACRELKKNWPLFEAIALNLLVHRTLTGEQVDHIDQLLTT